MKGILLICLICFTISDTISDDDKGPASNPKHYESNEFCTKYNPYQNGDWYDNENDEVPQGVSDCTDLLLWDKTKEKYNDRCCYVRFQKDGLMHAGCIGLKEENYEDISETIRKMENGDKSIWTTEGVNTKIYQLDCASSYLRIFSIAIILLAVGF